MSCIGLKFFFLFCKGWFVLLYIFSARIKEPADFFCWQVLFLFIIKEFRLFF